MNYVPNYLRLLTRVKLFLPFLYAAFLVCACSTVNNTDLPTDQLGAYNAKTIDHNGVKRTYQVYLPKNFNKTSHTPLVLALHGGGGTATRFEDDVSAGTLTAAAESRGIILLMPDGIDKRWNDGRPEIFNGDRSYDDVGFISTLIETMIQEYGVDASRVYVTGISNGGFMSMRLALELSEKIAAIAPVTAQLQRVHELKMPSTPISIMVINGTDDPLVPYNGGCIEIALFMGCRGEILSVPESIEKFKGYNQCTDQAETAPIIDNVLNDATSVEITRHSDCADGTEVVLVKVIGGGHTWPSGAQYLHPTIVGVVSREINASDMILDFFMAHPKN